MPGGESCTLKVCIESRKIDFLAFWWAPRGWEIPGPRRFRPRVLNCTNPGRRAPSTTFPGVVRDWERNAGSAPWTTWPLWLRSICIYW